jgi:hypothetical protein
MITLIQASLVLTLSVGQSDWKPVEMPQLSLTSLAQTAGVEVHLDGPSSASGSLPSLLVPPGSVPGLDHVPPAGAVRASIAVDSESRVMNFHFGPETARREVLWINAVVHPSADAARSTWAGVTARVRLGDSAPSKARYFGPEAVARPGSLAFRRGSVVVVATHERPSLQTPELLEAVATAVLYGILKESPLGHEPMRPVTVAGRSVTTVQIGGEAVLPVRELRQFGIDVLAEGHAVRLSRGDAWVRCEPFRWTIESSRGEMSLDVPTLATWDGLVVPATPVLTALGL